MHAETFVAASLDSAASRTSQLFVLLARMAQIFAGSPWCVARAIAASLLVLAACAGSLPAAAAPEPYEIPVMVSLTGNFAFIGKQETQSLSVVEGVVNARAESTDARCISRSTTCNRARS
jgi:hypothetical protein